MTKKESYLDLIKQAEVDEIFERISKTNLFENDLIYNIGNKKEAYFIAKRIFTEGFNAATPASIDKSNEAIWSLSGTTPNFRIAWKDLQTGETGYGAWLSREWLVDGYVIDFNKENPGKEFWKETK